MNSIISKIFRFREQLILVFMLELLHFSLWLDFASPLSRSLLLMHLGFFLIWQPIWQGEQKLRWFDIILLIFTAYAFVFWMEWWLLFFWVVLLIGLAGGRVIVSQRERNIYMLVLVFLVSELLVRCTPMMFNIIVAPATIEVFEVLLPILPLLVLVLPVSAGERRFQSVDFIHALSISALTGLLVAGALLNMYRTESDYLLSLIETLIVIGVFLMITGWLLIPRAGFSGLSQLWLRSMLNIGTPFENWLNELSILARQKSSPEAFLASAMEELANLPWIEGVEWQVGEVAHNTGDGGKHKTEIKVDNLEVSISSYTPVSGALYIHCKLLVQLINNFYVAKLRERELTQQAHLQAVYETGARITHDIKNLLQSLQAITSVIVHDSGQQDFSVSRRLLKKQLPTLTHRLKLALEKLQAPEDSSQETVYLKDWWQDLKSRISLQNLTFHSDLSGDPVIPADLFDSIIDNLLENIRNKVQVEPDISVIISLFCDTGNIVLTISDNGSRIPEDKARYLLKEPLQSDNGLGIGLYQATKLAESLGYKLVLKHNLDGNVCFELSKQNTAAQINLI
ncbi:MAG: ATP-binding protein [Gammaproteobacteria bacterium]